MNKKKFVKIFFIFFAITILILFFYFKFKKQNVEELTENQLNSELYNSNIIKDIKYNAIDNNGNEYIIMASEAEIDFQNPKILY